jgi:hypothetical protein
VKRKAGIKGKQEEEKEEVEDQEEENKLKSEALSVSTYNEVFLDDLPCKYGTQLMISQYCRVQDYSE